MIWIIKIFQICVTQIYIKWNSTQTKERHRERDGNPYFHEASIPIIGDRQQTSKDR